MLINLHPQRRNDTLSLSVSGDILTVNGEAFDFSGVPEGATLPAEAIASDFIGSVERVDGVLVVPIILPIGASPSHAQAFPDPIEVTEDGPVPLPQPEPEETADAE